MNTDEENSRLNRVSQFNLGALFCAIVVTFVVCVLLIYPSEIRDAIWLMRENSTESITIPYFSVKLHNDGNESISLPLQGQCLLWPPEPIYDYECGYEYTQTDGAKINSKTITVPAKGEKDHLIRVTKLTPIHQTKTSLARFLSAGDWHIQFIIATDQNGQRMFNSSRIPFTAEAMSSVYSFEVYRTPNRRDFLN
jgi:hypothetical protein